MSLWWVAFVESVLCVTVRPDVNNQLPVNKGKEKTYSIEVFVFNRFMAGRAFLLHQVFPLPLPSAQAQKDTLVGYGILWAQ